MAQVAALTGDAELFKVCETLFDDIVEKKMYITGGMGSTAFGEAFENAYTLPIDTAYAETCAAIAPVFFIRDLENLTGNSRYIDTVERVLYNCIFAGISLSGDNFFYANLLEVGPRRLDQGVTLVERAP